MNQKRQDEIAAKAVRKTTLRSIRTKKNQRVKQLKLDYLENLRKIELQYAKDPERLKAKYAAEDSNKSERARKRAERKAERAKREIDLASKSRIPSTAEELLSSIVQGIGAGLFIAATAILNTLAMQNVTEYVPLLYTMFSLFGASMIIVYICSCLSHALTNITAKDVFRRLSHAFSFLTIGFAYTSYSITKIQGVFGWVVFGIVWLFAIIGAVLYSVFSTRLRKPIIVFYAISGYFGLVASKVLYNNLSAASFSLLMIATGVYFVGLVFYTLNKVKFMHFIANIFILAGSVLMFFSMCYMGA